jgi:hypothetical protein
MLSQCFAQDSGYGELQPGGLFFQEYRIPVLCKIAVPVQSVIALFIDLGGCFSVSDIYINTH